MALNSLHELMLASPLTRFVDPPWNRPLDGAAVLRSIPETSTISGMFPLAVVQGAKTQGIKLPSAAERYVGFNFYPLREHAQLLVEASLALYPDRPLRGGLRALGRAGVAATLKSTVGRVVLGSAQGPEEVLRSLLKAYEINLRPFRAEIVESGSNAMIVRLQDVYFFLDSHHVGVFEGALRYAGAQGSVRIASTSATAADFLCTW